MGDVAVDVSHHPAGLDRPCQAMDQQGLVRGARGGLDGRQSRRGQRCGAGTTRIVGVEGQQNRAGVHELRRRDPDAVGAGRRGGGADLPTGDGAGHHLLGHREHSTDTAAPRRSWAARSRRTPVATNRAGDETLPADGRRPGRSGLSRRAIIEQIDAVAAPTRHRLHRPHADPPLRPAHPDRRDDGGAARRGQGRQGAVHRCIVDVGLAVRDDAVRGRAARGGPGSSRCRTSTA